MANELLTKCSRCGSEITFPAGIEIINCPRCGQPNSRPKSRPDETSLMKYANERRNMGEFSEAAAAYRKVLQACAEEHEARWGLLLCKYGVIYVEGSDNRKRLITCRIAQNSLFCAERDYQIVLSQAPTEVRTAYESDGKYIDDVQRGIQTLRPTIEKYDVFLCYKETSYEGGKTRDSEIARDIYHQMSQKGYRVFYAPESLKEKAGANYEAVIFLAIESSRAMLVIGTRKEYFNSIYVRSEWRRFKERISLDRSEEKKLIPLFLNQADLPDEIKPYHGFNMTTPNYMDHVYSILCEDISDDQKIKLIKSNIKEGRFQEAEATLNDMLTKQPQNAELWLLKTMTDLKVREETDLAKAGKRLIENNAFLSAIKFSTGSLHEQLLNCKNAVNKKLEEDEERRRRKRNTIVTIVSIVSVLAIIIGSLWYWQSIKPPMYASVNNGDHNDYAGKLQEHLLKHGYLSSDTKRELNTYDEATRQAVIRFCEQHNLSYSGGTVSIELYKYIMTNNAHYITLEPIPTTPPPSKQTTPPPTPTPTPHIETLSESPTPITLSTLPILKSCGTQKVPYSNVVVYTGPGTNYYRSRNTKGYLEKGSRVTVFGRINSWLFIRYDGGDGKDRFGYVKASDIDLNETNYPTLSFAALGIRIDSSCESIGDGPTYKHYFSTMQNTIDRSNAKALAQFTESGTTWIYFESTATDEKQGYKTFRGFVKVQDVTVK